MIISTLHFRLSTYIMQDPLSLQLATRAEARVWIETVLFAVINVAAFFGNLLTFYAVYRNHRLRTLPNMFVIALAVSDILMSTCCMPFTVATLFLGEWIFGDPFCTVHGYESYTFGIVSMLTMEVIAVSRYFCVVKPMKYPVLFTKRRILIYIAVIWCLAFIGALSPFFLSFFGYEFQAGKVMCLYIFESNIAFTVPSELFFIITPLIIIAFCYVKVFYTVSKANRVFSRENNPQQLRANVEEAKVTKTLAAVVVGFACCWLPISVMDSIDSVRGEHSLPREAYLTYSFLCYLSSTINPIIYGAMNKQFRQEYKHILCKIFRIRTQNNES